MTIDNKKHRKTKESMGFKDKLFWLSEDALSGFEAQRKALSKEMGFELHLSDAVNHAGRELNRMFKGEKKK